MIDFLDIILITIIVIVLGLLGGLLYLISLSIKKRLRLSGKLSDKLNKRINRTVFLIPCALGITIYCIKDYGRTPSKERLERISDIKLPTNFKVLRNEYQDMMQDYCILYDIRFDSKATIELVKGIKAAKFYNSNINPNSMLYDSLFIKVGTEKAIWCKSKNGYRFSRQDGLTTYSIELDTLTNILNYNECAD